MLGFAMEWVRCACGYAQAPVTPANKDRSPGTPIRQQGTRLTA
jgi:hypothetical protein